MEYDCSWVVCADLDTRLLPGMTLEKLPILGPFAQTESLKAPQAMCQTTLMIRGGPYCRTSSMHTNRETVRPQTLKPLFLTPKLRIQAPHPAAISSHTGTDSIPVAREALVALQATTQQWDSQCLALVSYLKTKFSLQCTWKRQVK
jgi:hypothetical protein